MSTTQRVVRKQLAGAEDLLQGIGTVTQTRGTGSYHIHKLDIPTPTYDIAEMQASSAEFMRLYGSDTAYTDYRRNPVGTIGIPSNLGGVWEPMRSSELLVCGNFVTGAYVFSSDCIVALDQQLYNWQGSVPKVVAPGATPATSGGIGAGAWVDSTGVTLRSELNAVIKKFNSVSGMVADTNLYAGQKTETINYYTNLLGGGCKYQLFNSTDLVNINGRNDQNASYYADGIGVFTTVGGLVAIPLDAPSFRRFGCVSDSITYSNVGTDSSSNAQALINFCAKTSQVAFVDPGKYYVHNLVQKKVYNGTDATGGSQFLGVCLFGSSRDSSIIYTNGNDFMDLSDVYSIVAENLTIASDRVRTPALGDPQGKCLFSSASGNYVRPRLHKVDIQRFEYGVYSPTGSWSSVYDDVFFTYCKTGLKVERSYGSYIHKCSFICKTAIECFANTCASFEISNNQFALGSYCSVFGGVDTTLKLYIDSITMNNNYMEAYAAVDATAVIMDLKVTQTARGNIENTYINAALYSPIVRQLYGVNTQTNTALKFRQNRYITNGNPKIWNDGGSVNVPTFIFDDSPCTETTSNVIAMNQQYVSSRKSGISIAAGQTAITLTDYIDSTMVGDQQIIAGGTLLLPVGHYDIHVYSRATSTADIYLRLSKSGVNLDFKIAANGSITNTVTQTIVNTFAGGWTATLVNSLSSGTATLNDLVITITPIKVYNTLINKL